MPPTRHHSVWFLVAAYVALVVYASLHPFDGRGAESFRWQSAWLWLPWPHYWGNFDIVANVLGYGPLGGLLTLVVRRRGAPMPRTLLSVVGLVAVLSWTLEVMQNLIPVRVPSRLDWLLNVLGALLGALVVEAVARWGWLSWLVALRDRWWHADDGGGLALLLLWPFALLVPTPVPMALGHFFDRFMGTLLRWAQGSSFEGFLMGSELPPLPLTPWSEMWITALGLAMPCLIVFTVLRKPLVRLGLGIVLLGVGIGTTALATALRLGPWHAMTWVTQQTLSSVGLATVLLGGLMWLPARVVAALGLVGVTLSLQWVNVIPLDPYFYSSLTVWEQGRFVRFHGVAQWISWLWPVVVFGYLMRAVMRPTQPT